MKISETIKKLEELKEKHGDLGVSMVESSWVCQDGSLNVWNIHEIKLIPEDGLSGEYIAIIV